MIPGIVDASNEHLLSLSWEIAAELESYPQMDNEFLEELCERYHVSEINIVDSNGVIIASTYEDFIGFDLHEGEQGRDYLKFVETENEYAQKYGPVSYDASISRKYGGVRLKDGGFVQVGYDAEQFQKDIAEQVIGITRNRHIGETGSIIIADAKGTIVSDQTGKEGDALSLVGLQNDMDTVKAGDYFEANVYGTASHCMYVVEEGYHVIAILPLQEMFYSRNQSLLLTICMEIMIFAVLFALVYHLIKKLIVDNIHEINRSLSEITAGNLDVVVDVRANKEFASLSDDINATVTTLKRYIAEAAARIDQELEFAREIQQSALPGVFPPFPHRTEFDIYAQMTAAKEVGGDFYDFYFVGEDRLAFIIADVSGKGIPAAMFMMTAKTLLKSLAEAGHEVQQIFTLANEKLCENNEAEMFLTAWMGILDVKTGKLEYANAGHNPPLIRQANQEFDYLKTKTNYVLADMEGVQYNKNVLQLLPGDEICLFTDGVPEAMNAEEVFYGNERLKDLVQKSILESPEMLCKTIKKDVDAFVKDAPQFDDITILVLKYQGKCDDKI